MRNITVGYFDLQKKAFISDIVINNNFIELLGRYVRIKKIPVNKKKDIKKLFSKIDKYRLDYLYIDVYNFLLASFLLREKFHLGIPFIFPIHTVFPWIDQYIYLTPLIKKDDIIYAVSNYAKMSFYRISDRFKVQAIPNCLDVNFIRKNISPDFKNDKKIISFMGRLIESKGLRTLIKCLPEISVRVKNVHLNIIGPLSGAGMKDRPKCEYVKSLEKTVKRLKLTDRVHFKGVQLDVNKYRMLSESDIFVNLTTAAEETFGIVNIEALACGLPVLATNWAGNEELIRNGKNGFLLDISYSKDQKPKINTAQLTSLIVKALNNGQPKVKMRRNSLSSAQCYDYRRVLPRLVSLLKKKSKGRVGECWSQIKDKTALDFRDIFNKDFFFFINVDNNFRKQTYASLYKKTVQRMSSKKGSYPDSARRRNRKKPKDIKIVRGLRQNLLRFLLLKSK